MLIKNIIVQIIIDSFGSTNISNGKDGMTLHPPVISETTKMNITYETVMNDDNQMQITHDNITATKDFCLEEFYCDEKQTNINGKLYKNN